MSDLALLFHALQWGTVCVTVAVALALGAIAGVRIAPFVPSNTLVRSDEREHFYWAQQEKLRLVRERRRAATLAAEANTRPGRVRPGQEADADVTERDLRVPTSEDGAVAYLPVVVCLATS